MKLFAASPPEGLDTSPLSDYWYRTFDLGSNTGYAISADKALHVSAFFAGVRLISETIGMVPLFIYERLGGSAKRKALDHPLQDILHDNPNPWQTAIQWKQMMTAHAILRGNGYSLIQGGQRGAVDRLIPLDPTRMTPEFEGDALIYKYRLKDGSTIDYPQDEMFHLAGFGDGVVGLSVVDYARETLGLALATEEHGARFFGQGARPCGLMKHPAQMNDKAKDNFKKGLKEAFGGVEKHHSIMVLEEGMEWIQIGISNEASQFLESRKFEVTEIARWLGLPPHVLADLEKASYNNVEEMSRELVVLHLMPWWVRWEQTIRRDLVMVPGRYFAEFSVDMLLRGDVKARFDAHKVAIEHGIRSPNEVRELENMNPRDDDFGDAYWMPLNFTTAGSPSPIEPQPTQAAFALVLNQKQIAATMENNSKKIPEKAMPVVKASAERLVRKEIAALRKWGPRYSNKEKDLWSNWLGKWYANYASSISESLKIDSELAESYCCANIKEIMEGGHQIAENWLEVKSNLLTELALGEER